MSQIHVKILEDLRFKLDSLTFDLIQDLAQILNKFSKTRQNKNYIYIEII